MRLAPSFSMTENYPWEKNINPNFGFLKVNHIVGPGSHFILIPYYLMGCSGCRPLYLELL